MAESGTVCACDTPIGVAWDGRGGDGGVTQNVNGLDGNGDVKGEG